MNPADGLDDAGESKPEDTDPNAGYTVRTVARMLGIPVATLRSWTRRYGVGPSGHWPGRHRRYTPIDVAVLRHMQTLIQQGSSSVEAARHAMAAYPRPAADPEQLLAAAMRLDSPAAARIVDEHIIHHGVIATWDLLCRPAFVAIEALQSDGDGCIDVEHLLSWTVTRCFQGVPLWPSESAATVVLACADEETHSLPLEALRAALSEHAVSVLMLGASVPPSALVDTVARRTSEISVVLWAQTPRTAHVRSVRVVQAAGARVLVAGPGWNATELPESAVRLTGLSDAVQQLR